jgi:fatty acid desaturase
MERASALAIDFVPKRKIPRGIELFEWYWQEIACCLWVLSVAILFATEKLHTAFFTHAYLMIVTLLMVNAIRTLAAHRYRNRDGEMTFENQFLDSVSVPGNLLTGIWAPVGLRFHGLHHLFPTMPYHSLAEAHRRIMETLPANSLYHRSLEPSLASALMRLWKDAQLASALERDKRFEQHR